MGPARPRANGDEADRAKIVLAGLEVLVVVVLLGRPAAPAFIDPVRVRVSGDDGAR